MARYDQIERPSEGTRIACAEDGGPEASPDPAPTRGSLPSDPTSAGKRAFPATCAGPAAATVTHMD